MVQDQLLQQARPVVRGGRSGHRDLERLDDLAVLHAGGAGRLAGPAVEAEVEVLADPLGHGEAAVGDAAHQVNAAARAVVLVAGLDVGRAGGRAEAAMDAVLEEAVVDLPGEPGQVDPRFLDLPGGGLGGHSASDPVSVEVGADREGVRGGGDSVQDTSTPARIHQAERVEGLLDLPHQEGVAPRIAPDAEAGLLVRRAARRVRGSRLRLDGQRRSRAISGERACRGRPVAGDRPDDPAPREGDGRPEPRIEGVGEGDGLRRREVRRDRQRPRHDRPRRSVNKRSTGRGRRPLSRFDDSHIAADRLILEGLDLPGDRGRVVLEPDGDDPFRRRGGRSPPDHASVARRPRSASRPRRAGSPTC